MYGPDVDARYLEFDSVPRADNRVNRTFQRVRDRARGIARERQRAIDGAADFLNYAVDHRPRGAERRGKDLGNRGPRAAEPAEPGGRARLDRIPVPNDRVHGE